MLRNRHLALDLLSGVLFDPCESFSAIPTMGYASLNKESIRTFSNSWKTSSQIDLLPVQLSFLQCLGSGTRFRLFD